MAMFEVGQKVKVFIYDNLFKDCIIATGILTTKTFGKLWLFKPNKHIRLSGKEVQIHEDCIFT